MSDKCPKCGAAIRDGHEEFREFQCNSWFDRNALFHQTGTCMVNCAQATIAAQAKEIAALKQWQQHVVNEMLRQKQYYSDGKTRVRDPRVRGDGWMDTYLANLWNNLMSSFSGDLVAAMESFKEQRHVRD